ncbi:MAG: hypothetical protein OXK80_02550 [Bdellovibrionales bacterium]|nr:hypothetical protein [Bdellovibrionales bacterium]
MKIFIYVLFCMILQFSWAAVVEPVKIKGVVMKYDGKNVTLLSLESKSQIVVPRKFISKNEKLKTGKEVIAEVYFTNSSDSKSN